MQEISASPSLNSYSSDLTSIAARVVAECGISTDSDDESQPRFSHSRHTSHEDREGDEEDDFEFSFIRESESSSISADEIFSNGQIKPLFPISQPSPECLEQHNENPRRSRSPLGKLFIEDRPPISPDPDDLQRLPPESYCLWSPGRVKKSNSSSLSKRWKIMNLLSRSDLMSGLTLRSKSISEAKNKIVAIERKTEVDCEILNNDGRMMKNRVENKKDLARFLPNVNDSSRSVHPF